MHPRKHTHTHPQTHPHITWHRAEIEARARRCRDAKYVASWCEIECCTTNITLHTYIKAGGGACHRHIYATVAHPMRTQFMSAQSGTTRVSGVCVCLTSSGWKQRVSHCDIRIKLNSCVCVCSPCVCVYVQSASASPQPQADIVNIIVEIHTCLFAPKRFAHITSHTSHTSHASHTHTEHNSILIHIVCWAPESIDPPQSQWQWITPCSRLSAPCAD